MKKITFFILFIIVGLFSQAQLELEFKYIEGHPGRRDVGRYVYNTIDGNIAVFSESEDSLQVLKLNTEGELLSRQSFAPENNPYSMGSRMIQLEDGSFWYFSRFLEMKNFGVGYFYIFDADCNLINTQAVSMEGYTDVGTGVLYQNEAGNIIFSCFVNKDIKSYTTVRIAEFTTDMDTVWMRDINNPQHSNCSFLFAEQKDDTYIFIGQSETIPDSYMYNIWIYITDLQGNLISQNEFLYAGSGYSEDLQEVLRVDDDIYISSYFWTGWWMAKGYSHLYKINTDGDLIFMKEYGTSPLGSYVLSGLYNTGYNTIYAVGSIIEPNGPNGGWFMHLNEDGTIKYKQVIEGDLFFKDIYMQDDNSVYISGAVEEIQDFYFDLCLWKFMDTYTGAYTFEEDEQFAKVSYYDNNIHIQCSQAVSPVQIEVFDLSGRLVFQTNISAGRANGNFEINSSHLIPSTYIVRCTSNEQKHVQKLVIR